MVVGIRRTEIGVRQPQGYFTDDTCRQDTAVFSIPGLQESTREGELYSICVLYPSRQSVQFRRPNTPVDRLARFGAVDFSGRQNLPWHVGMYVSRQRRMPLLFSIFSRR